jgi:uncharacterized protein YbjT (DUF2867 family)
VRKIVKLSAIGESTAGDGARPADWHAPGERLLAASGLTWSALRLLTDTVDGAAHTLTGPELLSAPEMVAQLGEEIGRPLETVDVPLDVARQQMLAVGFDLAVVDVAVRAGTDE